MLLRLGFYTGNTRRSARPLRAESEAKDQLLFFLRGSGYREGMMFPWVVSACNLMDAIESGVVKLPRVPVSDNLPTGFDMPMFRDLWPHVGKALPKKGAAKSCDLDPHKLPVALQTALTVIYGQYVEVDEDWRRAGFAVPPVFIVVSRQRPTLSRLRPSEPSKKGSYLSCV